MADVRVWIADTFEPLRPLYDAWMRVITGFSWILIRVLLTLTFLTVFLVYGVVLRISGRDPLDRSIETDGPSYWKDAAITNEDMSDFEKLY